MCKFRHFLKANFRKRNGYKIRQCRKIFPLILSEKYQAITEYWDYLASNFRQTILDKGKTSLKRVKQIDFLKCMPKSRKNRKFDVFYVFNFKK